MSGGDEYQVVAIAPSGLTRWALRTDWPVERLSEERRNEALKSLEDSLREVLPDVRLGTAFFRE